jgi:hypothetical protein
VLFVSFPVGALIWSAIVEPAGFGMAGSAWTSHETMTGFMIFYLSQSELAQDHGSDFRTAYPNHRRRG